MLNLVYYLCVPWFHVYLQTSQLYIKNPQTWRLQEIWLHSRKDSTKSHTITTVNECITLECSTCSVCHYGSNQTLLSFNIRVEFPWSDSGFPHLDSKLGEWIAQVLQGPNLDWNWVQGKEGLQPSPVAFSKLGAAHALNTQRHNLKNKCPMRLLAGPIGYNTTKYPRTPKYTRTTVRESIYLLELW